MSDDVKADLELDLKGLLCPLPMVKVSQNIANVPVGGVIRAVAATARMTPPTGTLAMFWETLTIGRGHSRPFRSSSRSAFTSSDIADHSFVFPRGVGPAVRGPVNVSGHRQTRRVPAGSVRPACVLDEQGRVRLLGLGEEEADADRVLDALDEGVLRDLHDVHRHLAAVHLDAELDGEVAQLR